MAEGPLTVGILDSVLEVFNASITGGWQSVAPRTMRLARQMAVIEVVLVAAGMFFARTEAMQRLLLKSLFFGFFAILLLNLEALTNSFVRFVVDAGLSVGGATGMTFAEFLRPSRIMALGMRQVQPLLVYVEAIKGTWSSLTHFPSLLIYSLALQVCWFCYLLIACHMVLAVIEFKLISVFGLVMIPWGLFTGTAFMAEGIIGGIVSSAVRLGVLAMVTSVTDKVLTHPSLTVTAIITDTSWNTVLAMLALSGMLFLISWVAPNYAASLLGSGPALTGTSLVRGALIVGGAAAAGVRAGARGIGQMSRRGGKDD